MNIVSNWLMHACYSESLIAYNFPYSNPNPIPITNSVDDHDILKIHTAQEKSNSSQGLTICLRVKFESWESRTIFNSDGIKLVLPNYKRGVVR